MCCESSEESFDKGRHLASEVTALPWECFAIGVHAFSFTRAFFLEAPASIDVPPMPAAMDTHLRRCFFLGAALALLLHAWPPWALLKQNQHW